MVFAITFGQLSGTQRELLAGSMFFVVSGIVIIHVCFSFAGQAQKAETTQSQEKKELSLS